jgi:hypothetical protein
MRYLCEEKTIERSTTSAAVKRFPKSRSPAPVVARSRAQELSRPEESFLD